MKTLTLLNDLTDSEVMENFELIINYANIITENLKSIFMNIYIDEENCEKYEENFIEYFLTTFYKLFSLREFLANLSFEILISFLDLLITALIKKNIPFLKIINNTILKYLDNVDSTEMFVILLDLLMKYKENNLEKNFTVIINLILNLTKRLQKIITELNLEVILKKFNDYVVKNGTNNDLAIKAIKTILNEIIKLIEDEIWKYYTEEKGDNRPIYLWIEVFLNQHLLKKSKNNLNYELNKSENSEEIQIKLIVDKFKKGINLEQTLEETKSFIHKYPGNFISYLIYS